MTAAGPLGEPGLPPTHLLTAAEYAELGETGWGYTELMEGRILVSPSPSVRHNLAGLALAMQLAPIHHHDTVASPTATGPASVTRVAGISRPAGRMGV